MYTGMIQPRTTPSKNHKNLSLTLSPRRPITVATTTTKKLAGPPSQEPQHVSHYDEGPAQILPDLYLGAFHTAQRQEMLAQLEISCILNVAHEIEPPVQRHSVTVYHHLRWTHTQNDLARRAFHEAIRVLEHAHKKNVKVLVHCQSGIERSAALVIAYILHLSRQRSPFFDKKLSLWEAYDYVRERAPGIRPNMELLYQLSEFERLASSPCNSSNTRAKRSGSVAAPRGGRKQQRPRAASVRVSSTSTNNSTHRGGDTRSTITCRFDKEIRKTTVSRPSDDHSAMLLIVFIVIMNAGVLLAQPRPVSPPVIAATAMNTKLCLNLVPSEPSTPISPLFLQSLFPIY